MLGLALVGLTLAATWWIWRIYRGDPPREIELPSKRALAAVGLAAALWVVASQLVEPRGSATVIDQPWLLEPVVIRYPYAAELAGREAIVDVSLFISASGQIERHEFTSAAPRVRGGGDSGRPADARRYGRAGGRILPL